MKSPLYLLSLFLGVVLVVHLAMNGQVGSVMKNTRVANAVFWCIGALTAVVIGLTGLAKRRFGGSQTGQSDLADRRRDGRLSGLCDRLADAAGRGSGMS